MRNKDYKHEIWRDAEVPTKGNFKDWGKKCIEDDWRIVITLNLTVTGQIVKNLKENGA